MAFSVFQFRIKLKCNCSDKQYIVKSVKPASAYVKNWNDRDVNYNILVSTLCNLSLNLYYFNVVLSIQLFF